MVEIRNGDRENARAWFYYSDLDRADASAALNEEKIEYYGLDESIKCFCDQIAHEECGDSLPLAILGFSQGAVFAHILTRLATNSTANGCDCITSQSEATSNMLRQLSRIQCAIMCSGFEAMHFEMHSGQDDGDGKDADFLNTHISSLFTTTTCTNNRGGHQDQFIITNFPSLHVFGEKDTSVPPMMSDKLSHQFEERNIHVHGKGHIIPQDVESCSQIISFLDTFLP